MSDAGIDDDFEGDDRPQGTGFDIGFDETFLKPITDFLIFLPLIMK